MRKSRSLALISAAAALLLLGAGWWFGSPWWTLWRMREAARAGDSGALAAYIDFPALRASTRSQLGPRLGPLGTALARPAVDALVSPAALRLALGRGRRGGEAGGVELVRTGASEFRIERGRGTLVFRRHGLGWKLEEIRAGGAMKPMALLLARVALAAPAVAEPPVADVAACSPTAAEAAGAALRSARAELAAVPPAADDTAVPLPTGRLIERVKDRMRGFVAAEMACARAEPELEALTETLDEEGGYSPSHDPAALIPDRHGDAVTYAVSRVPAQPDMLAVVATLGIRCGSDSMLLLYRRDGATWREAMVRRAEPYGQVNGGWGDLRFAVSPKDAQGNWFVATVSTTPWCTSAWQGLPYQLARPGPAPDRPRVFLRGKAVIFLGNEDDLAVLAERDAFELRHTGASIDVGFHNRRHVRRYAVRGETARRVQPVAENVRDFVDEWVVSPWSEAKDWSRPDPALAAIHARLHSDHYQYLDEFFSIRACGGGLTQVEMGAQEGPGWFFIVRGGAQGPWILERVARKGTAGCTGADSLSREPG